VSGYPCDDCGREQHTHEGWCSHSRLECLRSQLSDAAARAEKAEAALAAMRAEAEKWASVGWRDRADKDVGRADGGSEAAEAILAAGGDK
jgi:hypothetical protein